MPFQPVLHRIFALPALYDLAQALAGAGKLRALLGPELAGAGPEEVALDLGGRTGMYCPLLPRAWRYTCLDPDTQKLVGFRAKHPWGECSSGFPRLPSSGLRFHPDEHGSGIGSRHFAKGFWLLRLSFT